MAKLTKSQKARSQKVRLDKVSRDENRSQKRLLMAGALNNAAGIAIAAVASPVAGAVFTAAGNAVLAKQSLTVRGKAKSEAARIKRGAQPSKTMEAASALARKSKPGEPKVASKVLGTSETKPVKTQKSPAKISGRQVMQVARGAHHAAKRDQLEKRGDQRTVAGGVVAGVGVATGAFPIFAAGTTMAAFGLRDKVNARKHNAAVEDAARDSRIDDFRSKYGYRGNDAPTQRGGRLNQSEAERFKAANKQHSSRTKQGGGVTNAAATGEEPGVTAGGRGFANPNTQRAAQAAKGREWSGKTK